MRNVGSPSDITALLIVAALMGAVLWVQHRYVQSVERAAEERLADASEAEMARMMRSINIGKLLLRGGWFALSAVLLYALWRGLGGAG